MPMTTASLPRLNSIFEGFPKHLLPAEAFARLSRYYLALDSFPRVNTETGKPLVDEQTLNAMLREFIGKPRADQIVHHLKELRSSAFRSVEHSGPPVQEISWFELADKIVIYDGSPEASFNQLDLSKQPNGRDVVLAVQARFPSFEPELLTPDLLPSRIDILLQDDKAMVKVLQEIDRQLGWWAALSAVLLIPPAVVTRSSAPAEGSGLARNSNSWPLSMYVLGAALVGWTLTVVGRGILSPLE